MKFPKERPLLARYPSCLATAAALLPVRWVVMEMTMAVYLFSRAEHAALSQVAAGSMTLPRFLVDDNQPKTDLSVCAIAKGKKNKSAQ